MIATLLYLLLVVSFFVALFRGPNLLLYVSIFSMPMMQTMPNPLGTISVPINLVLLGLAIAPPKKPSVPEALTRLPIRGPILFLVTALLIGLAIRGYGELNRGDYLIPFVDVAKVTWASLTGFLLYALAFRHLRAAPRSVLRRAVMFCQLSLAGEGALTIIERVRGTARATAHLVEPNMAAAYFASMGAFFLAFALFDRTRLRWAYLFAALLGVAGVFNSLSRGGLLALVVSSGLVLAIFFTTARERTGTKIGAIVLVVLLAANAGLFVPQRVIDRILETFGGAVALQQHDESIDDSSSQRLLFWKAGWELFEEWPLGYGTTTFPQLQEIRTGYTKASHNVFVMTLVEQGAQGAIALLVFVFAVFAYLWTDYGRAQDDEPRRLALALMGWWVAHTLAHCFINSFYNMQIFGQFWMLVACLAGAGFRAPTDNATSGTSPSSTRKPKIASAASA